VLDSSSPATADLLQRLAAGHGVPQPPAEAAAPVLTAGNALRPSGSAWLARPTSTAANDDASRWSRGIGALFGVHAMAAMLTGRPLGA
jgi:hypothetical protein